ncbi:MAG: hypothetical protein H7256_06330 [Bdellovibrio sp.]|nr:hypothetical protein [Bdellovibrio sp.]
MPTKLSDLRKIFSESHVDKYVTSGISVMGFFNTEFKIVADPMVLDGGFAAEYFDLEYEAHLRPTMPEPYISLSELTADTNTLLKLHKKYYSAIKGKVALRNYFQTAFIGLLHTIQSIKKVQVGLPYDGFTVLTNLILEQGRLITSSQKETVTMVDFWWDYIWARFQNFPIDLIELGNQKLRGVWLNEKNEEFKKSIEKFLAAYSMVGLRKATNPVVYRDITNQILVRLAKNAYEIYILREDNQAAAKARIFKFKYEIKSGLTEDAEKTKREIATEGLKNRFRKLWIEPRDAFFNNDNSSVFFKIPNAFFRFLYNIYALIRYFVGFLLITFPFDGAFILVGLVILSFEGRVVFQKEYWPRYEYTAGTHKFINILGIVAQRIHNFFARIINDICFGFHMLFHYYTSDTANRNIRIGASLLMFGMGLFFSSARTMVESFVAQMSI